MSDKKYLEIAAYVQGQRAVANRFKKLSVKKGFWGNLIGQVLGLEEKKPRRFTLSKKPSAAELEKQKQIEAERDRLTRMQELYIKQIETEFNQILKYCESASLGVTDAINVLIKLKGETDAMQGQYSFNTHVPKIAPNVWKDSPGLDAYGQSTFGPLTKGLSTNIDAIVARLGKLKFAYDTLAADVKTQIRNLNQTETQIVQNEESATASIQNMRRLNRQSMAKTLEQGGRIMAELKIKLAEIEAEAQLDQADKDLAF